MKTINKTIFKEEIRNFLALFLSMFIVIIIPSCRKELLNEKPSSSIVVPSTLKELSSLLDYTLIITEKSPSFLEESSDDLYFESNTWMTFDNVTRNSYVWNKDIYEGQTNIVDWNNPYQQVFYANVVLDLLHQVQRIEANKIEWDRVKGSALFVRSYAFFNLLQLFAPAYDEETANSDLGIPLKLESDVNKRVGRSTVKVCYDQILADLTLASELLQNNVDINNPNRASKTAVFSLLARVNLSMRKYEQAGFNANESILRYDTIRDFNTISRTSGTPFPIRNADVIYANTINSKGIFEAAIRKAIVDSVLYSSYDENDLRKYVYFTIQNNKAYRKRGYGGSQQYFTGLATDEMLLIRAESYARSGKHDLAMKDLNSLMRKRWDSANFTEFAASSAVEALEIILRERRKELLFRGIRWSDLRRLNKEGANISLKRVIEGQEYTLPANDRRWVLPIPPDEILLNQMPQNER